MAMKPMSIRIIWGCFLKHSSAYVNPRLKLKSSEVGLGQQHFLKSLAL